MLSDRLANDAVHVAGHGVVLQDLPNEGGGAHAWRECRRRDSAVRRPPSALSPDLA